MNLTKIAIQNNRVSLLIFGIIFFAGLAAYSQLSRDSMPPYTVRVCTVVTRFPGASPERVEKLITEKIEKVAQELPELDDLTSTSRTGLSVISVELADDVQEADLQAVWDRLRRKIDAIQDDLPEGIEGPNVEDDDVGVVYGIMLALSNDGFSLEELKEYAEDIRDDLIKLEDASKVEINGVQEEQIFIEFDNARLAEIGLSASQLQSIISATNIVFPGGEVNLEKQRIVLEPTGNYEELEDLQKTLIPIGREGQTVELGSITNVIRGYKDPAKQVVKVNGEVGLTISIALKDGANLSKLGQEVNKRVEIYQATMPIGINMYRSSSQDYFVDLKVNDFLSNVIQSIVIVLAVMLLFLGFRTGIVVASLIPMAMVMTILLMNVFEIGLNQVSLAALIMALGMLVDNAIVVSESIMVKIEEGVKAQDAAIDSSRELIIPLLISSLTTSAAFLAFFLAESTMGEIMGPLFSVITLALLSSWILAMTMVTMLGVAFIRVNTKKKEENEKASFSIFEFLRQYYDNFIYYCLRRPLITIAIIIFSFVGSLFLFPLLPFIFFPDSDRNLITLDMDLPLGTKIEETEQAIGQIEKFIQDSLLVSESRTQGISDWTSFVGEGPFSYDLGYNPGEANSSYAHMLLNTSDFSQNLPMIDALEEYAFQNLPDAEVSVSPLGNGGNAGADVAIRVSGGNPEVLYQIAERIKQQMNRIYFSKNIKDDWGPKIKKFIVDVDQDKANRAGLTNQDIAISLRTSLSGFNSGSFREDDDNIPIMMRSERNQDIDATQLEGVNIFAQSNGQNVPLIQVANIVPDWQYAKILRRNLFRTMTVSCNVNDGYTASDITDKITPWLEEASKSWPPGYAYELGGESENSAEAMGAVADKLPIAGFIILLLLMLQFNSFRKTFIVLSTIPLGLTGVILGLLSFGSYFGFMAFLGVISLAGIVINNAIVLIDRIELEQNEFNRKPYDAIIEAARQRFRPILLTTFTTTLGLIPLYWGGGLMWEPMAISIMIGLLFATVITLVFVPVMYKVLFRVKAT